MSFKQKTLRELSDEARATALSKGWDSFKVEDWNDPDRKDVLPRCLFLIMSEVAEAGEAYRKDKMRGDHGFMEEMADVFIRIMDLMGAFPDDFYTHVAEKMRYNKERPMQHGGKKV